MKLILFIFFLSLTLTVKAQEYQKHHDDLSIRFNYSIVENAIGRLSNTTYSGDYITGRRICSSPKVTISTSDIDFQIQGNVIGTFGHTIFSTVGRFGVDANLSECISWSIGFLCEPNTTITDLTSKGRIGGLCTIEFGPFRNIKFYVGTELDPVIKHAPVFPIELTDTENISMEFGQWVDEQWLPERDKHKKYISYWGDMGATTSKNIPPNGSIKGEILELDASIGSRYYTITSEKEEYREHYLKISDFDIENDIFQLKIDQSFFLKKDQFGYTSGLLGELFPIRVYGTLDNNEIDVVLDGANVKYGTLDDENVIVVGVKVRSVSTGAFIEEAEGIITLSEPRMEQSKLVTYIKQFDLNMETKCFIFSICVSSSLLEHFESNRIEIFELSGEVELEIPNCIEMGSNRWEPDGGLCPKGTLGRRDTSNKSTRVIPLFEQTRIKMSEYAMTLTVPAKIIHYNPTRSDISPERLPDELKEIAEEFIIPKENYNKGTE